MNQEKFDAVFITGLVRNNHTRHTLSPEILQSYRKYCEHLVTRSVSLPAHMLYDRAVRFLEHLLDKSRSA